MRPNVGLVTVVVFIVIGLALEAASDLYEVSDLAVWGLFSLFVAFAVAWAIDTGSEN